MKRIDGSSSLTIRNIEAGEAIKRLLASEESIGDKTARLKAARLASEANSGQKGLKPK